MKRVLIGHPVVHDLVAPHAGAWIETPLSASYSCTVTVSHPTRVRGLKLPGSGHVAHAAIVAPHAGAWIETSPDSDRA